ncbi:MAG: hypothetical protein ACK4OJ_15305, partial [Brevundimonas sp.]
AKLAPGGIYVQWAPTTRSVATFRSVFPYVTRVHPALLGSDRPIPYSREKIAALLARPDVTAHLKAARIDEAELAKWFADKKIEVLNDGAAPHIHQGQVVVLLQAHHRQTLVVDMDELRFGIAGGDIRQACQANGMHAGAVRQSPRTDRHDGQVTGWVLWQRPFVDFFVAF